MKTSSFILLASLLLASCATQRLVRVGTPFDAGKARAMLVPGNNQLDGRVMAAMPNGTLVSCAGQVVSLVPVTDYAREWARQFYELDTGQYGTLNAAYRMDSRESKIKFVGAEAFYAATRTTRCDEDGNFSFPHVANGEFLVVAKPAGWGAIMIITTSCMASMTPRRRMARSCRKFVSTETA